MGSVFQSRNLQISRSIELTGVTLGTVIAVNDEQQMGRIKVMCPAWGDNQDDSTGAYLPWCTATSAFGGMTNETFKRGPSQAAAGGPVAYGFWNIPSIGSTVLVACIDGDPYHRVWLGSIFDQGCVSTLPHGRHFYGKGDGEPSGPFDGYGKPIEPLSTNMATAFGSKSGNYEWRSRGADFSAAGVADEYTQYSPSSEADETKSATFTSADGKSFDYKNGYSGNALTGESGDESSVYSWTTPGFHSISMDDRPQNCRVRIRTTTGAQILADDTNERIYISTPQGKVWMEMDYNGGLDVYCRRYAVHAEEDINLTAGKSVRIMGSSGVYMNSGADLALQAAGEIGITASGTLAAKGATVHLNDTTPTPAKWTNRVPQHEPWGRTMTSGDFSHDPEFGYNDPNVNVVENGVSYPRGQYWRR